MEWLEGETLAERLERELLTIGETIELGARIADTLALAHERGIVHRDLKPASIFLVAGSLDRIKVLDFGIARVAEPGRELTDTAAVLGTAGYLAPEQARSSRGVAPSADIYALGCLLFRCLTGSTPFRGDSAIDLIVQAMTHDPPRLGSLRPDVPADLDQLFARMLQREPSLRPADGRALAGELAALLAARRRAGPESRPPDLPIVTRRNY
jgi:serine/threonine protein kinase